MMQNIAHSDLQFAAANSIKIAYDTFGKGQDAPVLLIMGLGSQMILWDEEFCRQLASEGYLVIRFDNRDIGLSTKFNRMSIPDVTAVTEAVTRGDMPWLPYTLDDMAEDAIALLKVLDVGQAHIIGESMGGMIGQIIAVRYPEHLRSLTSIMSSTGAPDLPPPKEEVLKVLYAPFPTDRDGYIEAFVRAFEVLSGPKMPVEPPRARKWAEKSFDRGLNPPGVARQYAAILAAGDRTADLRTVSVPTLVIHGDADPLMRLECGQATAKAIPGAKLKVIKGMGHALPEAAWPQIIDAIANHAL
jgi:pimeloyl-ACP methyl ester carboxylesterase